MTDHTTAIDAHGLTKSFGRLQALDGVSFSVRQGELFGFLGPNGAGKTTTINLLTGLARPDAGTIRVGGEDCIRHPKSVQGLIGVVPDESNLYPELTGFENLCFCGALYGMPSAERRARARELLEAFGLSDAAHRKFAGYSKGMKRKATIAAGIMHRPPILFLDEPTTGIDVASARQIRRLISDMNEAGTTIFLTTHYIEEAERLCQRIAFIVAGRIVRTSTLSDLLEPVRSRHALQLFVSGPDKIAGDTLTAAFPNYRFRLDSPGQVRVEAAMAIPVGPLVRFLEERSVEVTEARRLRPSLEEVFVEITGIEADAMRKDRGGAGK